MRPLSCPHHCGPFWFAWGLQGTIWRRVGCGGKTSGCACKTTNLRKAKISFVISFCPSFRMVQLGSHRTDIYEFDIWSIFESLLIKLKFHWNLPKITALYVKTVHFYFAEFVLKREIVNKTKTHTFIFNKIPLPPKIVSLIRQCEEMQNWTSLRWQHNTAHARCFLDNKGNGHIGYT